MSAVMRVKLVSVRMPYIILRRRWRDTALNVHAPQKDKTDDVKGSLYEELERVFDKFPKQHMRTSLGNLNTKYILTPSNGNDSLHEINDDNGIRGVNFVTSKTSLSKVKCSLILTL
jgi:hypothetical protein